MSESTETGSGDMGAAASASPLAEPRWPIIAAVLGAILLQVGVPSRGRVPGWWIFPVLEVVLLGVLVYDILVAVQGINATALFGRGGAIWVTNVIVFSLWYWGCRSRSPRYPDYLFLSFTNATASIPPIPSRSGRGP